MRFKFLLSDDLHSTFVVLVIHLFKFYVIETILNVKSLQDEEAVIG